MFPKVINIGYYKNLSLFFFSTILQYYKNTIFKASNIFYSTFKDLDHYWHLRNTSRKKNYYLSFLPSKNSSFKKEKKIGQKISFILRDDTITLCSPHSQSLTSTAELTVTKKVEKKTVQVIFLPKGYFNHQKVSICQKILFWSQCFSFPF